MLVLPSRLTEASAVLRRRASMSTDRPALLMPGLSLEAGERKGGAFIRSHMRSTLAHRQLQAGVSISDARDYLSVVKGKKT